MTQRMKIEDRKAQLLTHGIKLARRGNYAQVTRKEVALSAGVSEALLSLHFKTMAGYRKALMVHAVATRDVAIVAQGLFARDKLARNAPVDLKQLALASITA